MKMITIEGPALGVLAEAITGNVIYRLRIADDGDGTIKIKINERMWTPPIPTSDDERTIGGHVRTINQPRSTP